ncbi:MAG: hypothetical protein IKN05_08765 [Clostridia bacterium]|nr:hypothetical protein [Clostridia bacterium]
MKASYHAQLPSAQYIYDSDLNDLVAEFTGDSVTVSIPVQARYAGSDEYTLDNTVLDRVRTAIANAKAIVDYYANCSDYVKLYGYAVELSRMIRYNDAAIQDDWDKTEKNPWHLVWALDNDPATDVVCEGYARAFQYLCELTSFDTGVRCFLAHGDAGGGHAWNIVRMDDGKYYLVDVTWTDGAWADNINDSLANLIAGETGARLFLIGGSGSPEGGYTLYYRNGDSSFRTYHDKLLSTMPASVLTLASGKYILNGFQRIQGLTYYFEDGHYLTGVHAIDGVSYDFGTSGALSCSWTPGWRTINGKKYYFDENGLHTQHTVEVIPAVTSCDKDGLTEGKRCAVCGVTLVEQDVVHARGHLWGEPYYTLSDDGKTMTAHRACVRDAAHQDTETVNTTATVTLQPTCTKMGKTTYTAVFKNKAFGKGSITREDIPAKGHSWGSPAYEWADDLSTVTATRVCANNKAHVETETVRVATSVTRQPTCTQMGDTTYTARFTNAAFTTQKKTVTDIPAKGHKWSTSYEWSNNNSSVIARRTCANDSSHMEWEGVYTTSAVAVEPTCTEMGQTTYTATFTNANFTTQAKTVTDIPARGHSWGNPAYEWASNNASVTARRSCANNPAHVQAETVRTTSAVAAAPTCTQMGDTAYTARFTNAAFATQKKTVTDIPAKGHSWGNPYYIWADDNSSVTARRVCANDSSHAEWETVYTSSVVTTAPTCTGKGDTLYTAMFVNAAFTTQNKTVTDIPATGHKWGLPTYEWSEDHASVTATLPCVYDPSHVYTETANTIAVIKDRPTCTAKGTATYTARFTSAAFTAQSQVFESIPPLGHKPVTDAAVPATYVSTGLTEGSHCERCGEILAAQQVVPALPRTSLAGAKVTAANQAYTGKALKPAVTVKLNGQTLKQGADYSVSYKNNVVGRATVTVTGVGAYTGKATGSFTIKLKKVTGLKLQSGAGKLTASWTQASGVSGYEVQYGMKSSFAGAKTLTVKLNKRVKAGQTAKATLKKLKSKKTYCVRIRAYKTVKGVKYCSAWSKAVKQKTK